MPVPRNDAALETLARVLTAGHSDRPDDVTDYAGYEVVEPDGWLWHDAVEQPGLQDVAAYGLSAALAESPEVHAAPAAVLDEGGNQPFTAAQQRYCRTSLDVTMKGGTTSGVIYPLALCELARSFRFRNLGGASAGAIAASLAAAAELGRARAAQGDASSAVHSAADVAQGRLRQGFAGLADIVAWLTQRDRPAAAEQFRLVQLFKPTPAGLPLFRVIAAVMRQQLVRGALLLLIALPGFAPALTLAPLLVAPVVLAALAPWRVDGGWLGPRADWLSLPNYLWAAVLLWAAFAWIIPLLALWLTRRPKPADGPAGFAEPMPMPGPPEQPRGRLGMVVVAVVALGAWVWAALYAMGWRGLVLTTVVLVAELLIIVVLFGVGLAGISTTAKQHRYGLIGGAGGPGDDRGWRGTVARLVDRAAHVLPRRTVDPNLTDWLTQAMADLAGLGEREVLRFGHLWTGGDYQPGDPTGAGRTAADNPRARSVNLELMSTELIRRAPYRFPLPTPEADEQLYFDAADLAGVLPQRVIDAMTGGATPRRVRSLADGRPVTLHPLPAPADLPVVFATRCSLALPALFQAVRLYELRTGSAPVRTEFGARLTRAGAALNFPADASDAAPAAQELWLTDGGVTSNFPIHMFDSPLPLWPTVGIDLADHPAGAGHQDVYLLGDARAARHLAAPLKPAMSSFLGAILGTSLQWRDNAQLQMPAFQARIAVVRQRGYEGGNNLFMTRADIASLALRGVVAGMRLRRRFASDAQWQRQQWLRLRVAGQNVVEVAERLRTSLREQTYARLVPEQLSGAEWSHLQHLQDSFAGQADPDPAAPGEGADSGLDWYLPDPTPDRALDERGRPVGFFANLTTLVSSARYLNADPAVLKSGVPRPLAELRQVPRS